jgi:hypothetical protein
MYYISPPIVVPSTTYYQDINKDSNLRKLMTEYYLEKNKKWNKKNISFKEMYNLLRSYVNKKKINWYDLKLHKMNIKKILKYFDN